MNNLTKLITSDLYKSNILDSLLHLKGFFYNAAIGNFLLVFKIFFGYFVF